MILNDKATAPIVVLDEVPQTGPSKVDESAPLNANVDASAPTKTSSSVLAQMISSRAST